MDVVFPRNSGDNAVVTVDSNGYLEVYVAREGRS